jgi:DNA-binding LacI/PurR family transcriptional regulator
MSTHSRPRVTISDVARTAGVSIATVSRVLNSSVPVTGDTAQKVQRAIDLLGFQPHLAARTLAGGKTNTIGLLVPDLSNPFFAPLVRGVELCVRAAGFDLLIYSACGDLQRPRARTRPLNEDNTDGLLIFTNNLEDEEIVRLHAERFPLVLLMRSAPGGLAIPTVMFDNAAGVRAAIQHLVVVCGRRRIGFLQGPPDNEDSQIREVCYRQLLAQHHLPFDPQLVTRGDFSEQVAYRAVKAWINQGVCFDALFTGDDLAAIGAIRALREAHIEVPAQVSVIGFDDVAIAQHFSPALTTIYAPIEEAGQRGAELLIQQIAVRPVKSLVLPTRLIVRQSCGGIHRGENHETAHQ